MYRELAGLHLFNPQGYTFRFNLSLIFGALWRYNIEVSVRYYRQFTGILPRCHRLLVYRRKPAGCLSDNSWLTVGQPSTDRWLTVSFGSSSSQLPHYLVMDSGVEIATHWSPVRPKIRCWRTDIKNWSPMGDSPFLLSTF